MSVCSYPPQTQKLEPFVLKNRNGIEAHILPYGAIVQKLVVPSRSGSPTDIVLGFDNLTPYQVEYCAASTVKAAESLHPKGLRLWVCHYILTGMTFNFRCISSRMAPAHILVHWLVVWPTA